MLGWRVLWLAWVEVCGSLPVVVEERVFVALGEESREACAEQREMCGQTQKRQRVRERWREQEDLEILPLACDSPHGVKQESTLPTAQQDLHPHTTSNETLH